MISIFNIFLSGSEAYWGDTRQNIYTAKTDWVIQPNPHNVIKIGFEFNQYNVFSDQVKYDPQTTYFGQVLPDLPISITAYISILSTDG